MFQFPGDELSCSRRKVHSVKKRASRGATFLSFSGDFFEHGLNVGNELLLGFVLTDEIAESQSGKLQRCLGWGMSLGLSPGVETNS